ncbi:hypothetical protein CABS03_15351 [Colletotrichum abscissum]
MSRLEAQYVEHITIYHKRITKSRGIRNDEDIYHWAKTPATTPESSSSAPTAPTSPTTAERQKAILTTTAQKAQSETKTTPIVPTGRFTRLRYAEVGWLGSSGAQRQAVYGCLNTSGQLRYWSCSAQDDGGSIRHEEISFCPEFQGLSQDDIRKKLLEKIHRAARRNVQDES